MVRAIKTIVKLSQKVNYQNYADGWSARIDTLSVIIAKFKAPTSSLEDVQNESTVTDAMTTAFSIIK